MKTIDTLQDFMNEHNLPNCFYDKEEVIDWFDEEVDNPEKWFIVGEPSENSFEFYVEATDGENTCWFYLCDIDRHYN